MTRNPRDIDAEKAETEIAIAAVRVIEQHPDLTCAEITGILLTIAATWNRYGISDEREKDEPHEPNQ